MFEVSGPHTGPLRYEVIDPDADTAICECWRQDDAQQIADALNQQATKLARLETQFVSEQAVDGAAARMVAAPEGGAA